MWLEKCEGPKGVSRIRKSKIDLQHNEQKKKDKRTNDNLQKHYTKDRTTQNSLKREGELRLRCPGRVSSSCSIRDIHCVIIVTNPVTSDA